MKKILVALFVCAGVPALAGTYYVDANNGNDAWSGTTDYAHRDVAKNIGPRKTLVKIMEVATASGDVVYAAAGTYDEGSAKKDDADVTLNRVVVPAGVKLQSTEGAKKTFIVGAPAPGTSGNGNGATRCVALNKGSSVVGFTLTGGHTATSGDYVNDTGGAVCGPGRYGVDAGYVVSDCIVSNNTARSGYSPAGESVTWVRCQISGMSAPYCYYGQFYNCYVGTDSANTTLLEQPRTCYACTIRGNVSLRKGDLVGGKPKYICTMYNSIVYKVIHSGGAYGGDIYDCLYSWADSTGDIYGNCTQVADWNAFTALEFDAEGRVASPLVREQGNNAFVDQLPTTTVGGNIDPALVPTAFLDTTVDLGKGQRIYAGRVDYGAWEHDVRPDIAAALAPERLAVKNVTPDVRVTEGNLPILTNASEMAALWTAKAAGTISYGFTAEVTGDGTLSCYKEDEAEPFVTVTSGDETKQVPFTSTAATVPLRFAFSGEGLAVLSRFVDEVSATITDAKGGLALGGISLGKTVVGPGETLTFTVSRNFDTDRLCTGFVLNGTTFVDFKDYPDGWTHTLDTPFSSVTIEAQYKTSQDFYVDPVNGDDAKSGFLPSEAWRTLATIATNANVRSGDVVYAAAGVYDRGTLKKTPTDKTFNRVVVPAGVKLKSLEGPEKTFIVGAPAPGTSGNGDGATRCVALMGGGSAVIGFTLTGGRTGTGSSYPDDYSGAALGEGQYSVGVGYVVSDCIVTNNFAAKSAAGCAVTWVRCRITSESPSVEQLCSMGQYYSCYLKGCYATYRVIDQPRFCYGCTINGSVTLRKGSRTGGVPQYISTLYNTIVLDVEKPAPPAEECGDLYDCLYSTMHETGVTYGDCTQVSKAEFLAIPFDESGRTTSPLVMNRGSNALVTQLPVQSAGGNIPDSYIPAEFDSGLDLGKGQRIYDGRVDRGAWEYDIRADIAAALAPSRVAVTNLSPNVTRTVENLPVLTNGSTLAIAWTKPSVGGGQYGLTVQVSGDGTLSCYKGGATEPFATVTAADGAKSVKFESEAAIVDLRFAFAGEGTAVLSRFLDQVYAIVTDAKGGLVGLGTGTTVFTEPQVVTFTRNFATDRLCTGIILNGRESIDFNDYPDGWQHTFDSLESSVTIEAQYATAQDFYVDPVAGDDAKSGFLPSEAWRTLATIATNANVRPGDTVYAAAGTYDQGALKRVPTDLTLNRVIVPAGVTLQSLEGPEKTFIVGADAPGAGTSGLGEGATRCVDLEGSGSSVVGFTLTGGRTGTAAGTSGRDSWCAAVLANSEWEWGDGAGYTVADCIVSNNAAASVAHAGASLTWVRCNIVNNGCSGGSPNSCCHAGRYYHCNINGNGYGQHAVIQPYFVYGCRLGDAVQVGHASNTKTIYNSVVRTASNINVGSGKPATAYLADCVFVTTGACIVATGNSRKITADEYVAMDFDIDGRTTSALVRDQGNNDWVYAIPAAFGPLLDKGRGQRIYNGTVDIGPYEYDMRPDFAKDLSRKLKVTSATTNVVETAARAVRLRDGQALTVTWADPAAALFPRTFPLTVSAGTLTVKVNGETAATFTADGVWEYAAPTAADVLTFEFAASEEGGFSELGKTIGGSGLLIFLR